MTETLIGYARCSTDTQDLTAQRDRLRELGVAEDRSYLDHGLTGTNRKRPGLDQALAAGRGGDTFVVPKLDRLARSVPDARAIGDDLAARCINCRWAGRSTTRPTRWAIRRSVPIIWVNPNFRSVWWSAMVVIGAACLRATAWPGVASGARASVSPH
jgi:hypothetical protein